MGREKSGHALAWREGWLKRTEWLQGVWLPSGKEWTATRGAQNDSLLEFLKTTKKCTAVAMPRQHQCGHSNTWAAQWCLYHACPLEKALGLMQGAVPHSREHQGCSETNLPAPAELGRGLRTQL